MNIVKKNIGGTLYGMYESVYEKLFIDLMFEYEEENKTKVTIFPNKDYVIIPKSLNECVELANNCDELLINTIIKAGIDKQFFIDKLLNNNKNL